MDFNTLNLGEYNIFGFGVGHCLFLCGAIYTRGPTLIGSFQPITYQAPTRRPLPFNNRTHSVASYLLIDPIQTLIHFLTSQMPTFQTHGKKCTYILSIASFLIASLLTVICCAGFKRIYPMHTSIESNTNFICLCLLGVLFGVILAIAELQWEKFYVYFGFLRFRLGRAILYGIAGPMTTLLGRNLKSTVAIVEGVGCMLIAVLQVFATCVGKGGKGERVEERVVIGRKKGIEIRDLVEEKKEGMIVEDKVNVGDVRQVEEVDPNFPAWMRT